MIPKQALTQGSLEESCLMIHIRMSMSMCWRGVYVQHTHSGRTGHWAANAVRITKFVEKPAGKTCHTQRDVRRQLATAGQWYLAASDELCWSEEDAARERGWLARLGNMCTLKNSFHFLLAPDE